MERNRSAVALAGVVAIAVLAAPGTPCGAQDAGTSVLVVDVADAASGQPIASAEVVLPELRRVARPDVLGRARVRGIPFGEQRLRVRALGYAPSEVRVRVAGDTTGAVFRLERVATSLPSVAVTDVASSPQMAGFETRRRQGIGRFITGVDLARDGNRSYVDVATTRFPGLRLIADGSGKPHIASGRPCGAGSRGGGHSLQGRRSAPSPAGLPPVEDPSTAAESAPFASCSAPCFVQVYLDDILLGRDDDDLVRTWDLAGAEYYTGASMPAQYRTSGSACGVLLLWSRSR